MKKIIVSFFILFLFSVSYSQTIKAKSPDDIIKEQLYDANKKRVTNFSRKDFDKLFFEFYKKQSDPNLVLSKEEFYAYTMKIAAFSDRLAKLYPSEKEMAEASKKKWFAESYEDYLLSKAPQKK